MYPDWAGPAAAGLLVFWLGILSLRVWKQGKFFNELFPKSGERDIRKKFEEVLGSVENSGQQVKKLEEQLSRIEIDSLTHIQRVELLRYNPYDDTGGNISFSLALLDEKGNGFVLTSLHARGGTRVFAKPVVEGKAEKYELSEEEKHVIDKALKKNKQ